MRRNCRNWNSDWTQWLTGRRHCSEEIPCASCVHMAGVLITMKKDIDFAAQMTFFLFFVFSRWSDKEKFAMKPKRQLVILNLDEDQDNEGVLNMCKVFGNVVKFFRPPRKHYAFVSYEDARCVCLRMCIHLLVNDTTTCIVVLVLRSIRYWFHFLLFFFFKNKIAVVRKKLWRRCRRKMCTSSTPMTKRPIPMEMWRNDHRPLGLYIPFCLFVQVLLFRWIVPIEQQKCFISDSIHIWHRSPTMDLTTMTQCEFRLRSMEWQ